MPKPTWVVRGGVKYCPKHPEVALTPYIRRKVEHTDWVCLTCAAERTRKYHKTSEGKVRRIISGEIRKAKNITIKGEFGEYTLTENGRRRFYQEFHIRPEEIVAMYEKQKGRCAFGGEPLTWENVVVDHDHNYPGCNHTKSGNALGCPKEAIRGLVCARHNQLEGWFASDPRAYMDIPCWHARYNGGQVPCHCEE